LAFAAGVVVATTAIYDFRAVNHAFKSFFYYRTVEMADVFAHRVNRFELPQADGDALRQKTRTIWRNQKYATELRGIPAELYYVAVDLKLLEPRVTHGRRGTLFNGRVATFDLVRPRGGKDPYYVVEPAGWERRVN
jgi:hypothetical protein